MNSFEKAENAILRNAARLDVVSRLSNDQARLKFEEEALGKGNPEIAETCYLIACDYLDLGNCEEAMKYFRKIFSIYKKFPELEKPKQYLVYEDAGYTCECLEKYKQALKYYLEAVPGYEENCGTDDDRTGHLYYRIAAAYAALNQEEDTRHWLERTMNTPYEPEDKESRKYFRGIKVLRNRASERKQ